jgi:Do/DeqQ family serine protease
MTSTTTRTQKTLKLIAVLTIASLAGPYVLGKLNFYSPSHATTATTPTASSPMPPRLSYADAVEKATPAVVSIKTTKEISVDTQPLLQDPLFRYFFGDPRGDSRDPRGEPNEEMPKELQEGMGSGVIVNTKGYILTNNHVVKNADTVMISLADGRTGEAKVIGTDPDSDLAVLKIDLPNLPVISMGSSQHMRVGDIVLAIGNPFGIGQTVTQGIISATERSGTNLGVLENFLQTDAAINPGNSGGALIDANGQLIGINTAILSRSGGYQGIGFAIPIDQASEVMEQLISGGRVIRGYLGVQLQNLNKEIREYSNYQGTEGVYARAVVRGSPAQKAGLLPGDVITKINNTPVKDNQETTRLVASLTPGKGYPIEVFRQGDYISFTIVLGERKQPPTPSNKK